MAEKKSGSAEIGLHTLRPKPGARRPRKRIGRGEGSGTGKQAGRGHKGAGSRSGSKRKIAYEGGQNPIHMRMRKLRGPQMKKSMPFENFRTHSQPVNLADLEERFDAGAEVTPESLREKGLAKRSDPVKILARGEISKKLTVRAHAFSAAAKAKIEAAGGTVEWIDGEPEPPKKPAPEPKKPKPKPKAEAEAEEPETEEPEAGDEPEAEEAGEEEPEGSEEAS
jgi:large subunit ribosomal protein L15